VAGAINSAFAALATCKYADDMAYYLFYCDDKWNVVTDTYHQTVVEAKAQAEFEFAGASDTWQ
jgi:hypothetical protein